MSLTDPAARMTVQVVTPDRQVVAADDATFVLAHGVAGDVGIMPNHAPLMIALGVGPLRVDRNGQKTYMVVDGGFLQVSHNQVIILAEIVVLPEDVSLPHTQAEIKELESVLARAEDADARAKLNRAKAVEAMYGMLKM